MPPFWITSWRMTPGTWTGLPVCCTGGRVECHHDALLAVGDPQPVVPDRHHLGVGGDPASGSTHGVGRRHPHRGGVDARHRAGLHVRHPHRPVAHPDPEGALAHVDRLPLQHAVDGRGSTRVSELVWPLTHTPAGPMARRTAPSGSDPDAKHVAGTGIDETDRSRPRGSPPRSRRHPPPATPAPRPPGWGTPPRPRSWGRSPTPGSRRCPPPRCGRSPTPPRSAFPPGAAGDPAGAGGGVEVPDRAGVVIGQPAAGRVEGDRRRHRVGDDDGTGGGRAVGGRGRRRGEGVDTEGHGDDEGQGETEDHADPASGELHLGLGTGAGWPGASRRRFVLQSSESLLGERVLVGAVVRGGACGLTPARGGITMPVGGVMSGSG